MKNTNLIYPGNLNLKHFPYIITWVLYYAWEIVYTTWWTASPLTSTLYNVDVRIIIHSINLLSSAFFILILKKEWFTIIIKLGSVFLFFFIIMFYIITLPKLHILIVVLMGISLGVVNIGILIPFVFILNNTEKIYAVVVTNFLIGTILFLQEESLINIANGYLPSIFMLGLSMFPIIWFRKCDFNNSFPTKIMTIPKAKNIVYITIAISAIYGIACKGVGKIFMQAAENKADMNINAIFYLGALIGCSVYLITYGFSDNAYVISWNITFATFVVAVIMFSVSFEGKWVLVLSSLFLGVGSSIGIINMYYIMGVIGKKYNSYAYIKSSIVILGGLGGISGMVIRKWGDPYIKSIAIIIACISSVVVVILLMLSPTLSRKYFREEWVADAQKPDIDNEHFALYSKYNLSKREVEICNLFLQGYTMRQIAVILDLSYATVNTYQTSLYRKLNINSKTELFIIFKDYIK